MLFLLADDVFAQDGDDLLDLLRVLRLAFEGRLRIHIGRAGQGFRSWITRRTDAERAWIELALDASARDLPSGSPCCAKVLGAAASRWDLDVPELSVGDAARLASAPLRLLLEDFADDGHFLAWIGKALGNSAWSKVRDAMRRGWIVVTHGGGNSSMLRLLRALGPDASPRPWGLEDARGGIRPDHHPCRHWVMFDHDGTEPGDDRRGATAAKLAETCRTLRVRHHPLRRRSIENYLPSVLLQRWSTGTFEEPARRVAPDVLQCRQRLCDAFSRLSKDQQRHYYFREGLRKDADRETGAIDAAFASIPCADQWALACGFDAYDKRGVTRLFSDPRAAASAPALREDGSYNEAVEILQGIAEAL